MTKMTVFATSNKLIQMQPEPTFAYVQMIFFTILYHLLFSHLLGMGDTQNFIHDIYREKVLRYWVYCDTGFAIAATKLKLL